MDPQGLGELEQLALLAVLRLGDTAYAVSVREEIQARTGRDVSRGAIYVTLDRMERKGYVRSKLGSPTPERGGKAKRLFTVAAPGQRALRAALQGTQAMLEGLPPELAWKPPR
ncbi:MAG TPA: helix-turn-helix transcriptional regulator [Gemmatimonadaceae bacterium]